MQREQLRHSERNKIMKRVLVIGSGGAGKTTFSKRLSELTGIAVIHLDAFYWQPNWTKSADEDWKKMLAALLEKDSWIMDGNYTKTMEMRLQAADTIIFLDISRLICAWRVTKRFLIYRQKTRPDMAQGCNEKLDLEFLEWIWNFPKINKPPIEEKLRRFENKKTIIRLTSKREIEAFFVNFPPVSVLE